jgi:hypothetical protein
MQLPRASGLLITHSVTLQLETNKGRNNNQKEISTIKQVI